jgi:hypothetical protein
MIDHLSYSSISKYLKCGKQWKYRYIDKLQEESSEALLFGSAWHKMIKYELQEENNNLLDSWYAVCEEWDGVKLPSPMSDELIQLGEKMLTSPDITKTIQGLSVQPESLEMETELHIPGVPVPIIGFIDMIDLDSTPIDIKTSGKKWSQQQADTSLQPTFYLAALEQLQMVKLPAKFKYIVFTKAKNPTVQILETTRTHEDVFALYGLIGEVWQAIQKEVFTPTDPGNWWCHPKYCGFWDVCEYGGKR